MSILSIDQTLTRIRAGGIIAIVRGRYSTGQITAIADVLAAAGLTAMEITLNSSDALALISHLRRQIGDRMLIGAGTVRSADDVRDAAAAGAQFLIAPGFDPQSVLAAQSAGILHLPGVFTPTEAQLAAAAGCRLLKLFPADALGPAYLKSIRAPLNDVDFVPTGGVNPANVAAWRQAGAVAVAAGSTLVAAPDQSPDDLADRANAFRRAWEEAADD